MPTTTQDPYQDCPVYETEQFILRLVEEDDVEDLLECYSDPGSARLFNSENCTSDFVFGSVDEMRDCIRFWVDEYRSRSFVRFSIVDRVTHKAVGTIEIFVKGEDLMGVGKVGVLRVDLASRYETTGVFAELMDLAGGRFYDDFAFEGMVAKAIPEAEERVNTLRNRGYTELRQNDVVWFESSFIQIRGAADALVLR